MNTLAVRPYSDYLHEAFFWIPCDAHPTGSFTDKEVGLLEALFMGQPHRSPSSAEVVGIPKAVNLGQLGNVFGRKVLAGLTTDHI